MKIAHFRLYRLARVALALAKIVPRYSILIWRSDAAPAEDWDRVHTAAAREIGRVALALAGGFTKIAQVLGSRADILPAPFIDELSQFHDAVPARPFETLRPRLERELGRPLADVFRSFDVNAMAAASLAQVHRATLYDGSAVAVKLRYPEIDRIIPLDLSMLRFIAHLIVRIQSRVDFRSLALEVARFVELELDFEREVDSMERMRETLAARTDVCVPRAHRALCGKSVIVMEYLEGIQVTKVDQFTAAGHKPSDVAKRIGGLYGAMIFEHGFFHGDPHPGNLLVMPDGRIALLDFGLCKELPKDFASLMAQMVVGSLIGDYDSALASAEKLGFDLGAIEGSDLRSLFLMLVGDSDGESSFLDLISENRIRRIPEDFTLVARTLVLLNGLSHRLAPNRRLIQAELLQHLAQGAARAA